VRQIVAAAPSLPGWTIRDVSVEFPDEDCLGIVRRHATAVPPKWL